MISTDSSKSCYTFVKTLENMSCVHYVFGKTSAYAQVKVKKASLFLRLLLARVDSF